MTWYRWDFKSDKRLNAFGDRARIMKLVCEEFEISVEQLKGKGKRNVADARKVYSYLTRKIIADTHHRIANELNCDHSYVIWQIKRIEEFISIDDMIVTKIRRIEYKFFKTKNQ
jgi:chromosomal replication initiation ATPase DnaA